jgi:hypothetical protein
MRLDFGVDALIGAGNERIALLDFRIETPVASRPIRMLAEKADPSRNEDLHNRLPEWIAETTNLHEFHCAA